MDGLKIVCFLWFDPQAKCRNIYTYTADHVRLLKRMVDRHMTLPHEFVCVTDRPELFSGDSDIRAVKLDKTTFVPGSRFTKLMLWRGDIGGIIGKRIGYLDLDCVICRNIDNIFARTEDVVLWRNPNYGIKSRRARYNTSIMLLDAGARPHLYDKFDPAKHPPELRKVWGGTDQAWISNRLSETDEAYWTSDDGVYGAGRLRDVAPGVTTELPEDARIVFFPGPREPGMPNIQEIHPWIKDHLY